MSDKNNAYWQANIRLIITLLVIWFIVSFGAGILFVDQLDKIHIGGFPLGFWFAEQGSIYVFVLLIIIYTFQMNRLDKKFNVEE
ncbi:MAG: hypothetical protein CSA44_01090 [Gammaproteobacteria bacterium]|nr:MAG: hypothetical protein CSA44_01090 [Gammaproteobacteria bacterium]